MREQLQSRGPIYISLDIFAKADSNRGGKFISIKRESSASINLIVAVSFDI